ncbi:MAG: T9SS type A sorting domain-containing protein, partial [candidate division WOR-3 bacterium]
SIMHFFSCLHGIAEEKTTILQRVKLSLQICPNPCRDHLVIKFEIRHPKSEISLSVYDVSGRVVKQFNHLTIQPFNQLVWDGRDDLGRKLPAGVYFVRLEAGDYKQVEKAVLLR